MCVSYIRYCEFIIIRDIPIFIDFVDSIKPGNKNLMNICHHIYTYLL